MNTVTLSTNMVATEANSVSTTSPPHQASWQSSLKHCLRSVCDLRRFLGLPNPALQKDYDFPVLVPLEYARRIRPGDPDDPLLRQVLPTDEEGVVLPGFQRDAVGDLTASRAPGLIQKYAGRALLITTSACAVHCRYCFRRHYPYSEASIAGDFPRVLKELGEDSTIFEVILSGGDPLMLPDDTLGRIVNALEERKHIRRLRIHTRLPILIPQRVTDGLLQIIARRRFRTWMVVHANHPQELDAATLASLERLVDAGIPMLNQAVLLRGVNDNAEALIELCRTLVDHRVTPYYLHQLDRVQGAAHFEVSLEKGLKLLEELQRALPGYAVPRYVRDRIGLPHKEILA